MMLQVNSQLAQYGGVNRRALEQYDSFTEQRTELATRLAEQAAADAKIR